ncbi:PhzF family phenazine biosynthesis protein [Microbacterium sulfonylureivorans]|uniref:PhzF family phenazine biosynthesis protein n=1 Tax=Microbacterium sulfonylureivorans TaxID=2486854 RepID=UPI000FDAB14F|nr:PhzF family phenazine biosynthesis protein [Microbacterium sulfonylureivorans]
MVDVPFFWVDVFAERALTGNPLALVPDADALDEDLMRTITKEFNQSETTFLMAPTLPGADHRLRSFTVGGVEVLGAGHNAMGAWIWLAEAGLLAAERGEFAQQIGAEVLPVRVGRSDDGRVLVTMRQGRPRFLNATSDHAALSEALGLSTDDLTPGRPSEVVSTGAEHLLVSLRTRDAVDRAVPDTARLRALLAAAGAEGCYVYSTEAVDDPSHAYSRFFNPTVGIVEDPATGTAAGPLAVLLVRDGIVESGRAVRIEQGRAMGRSSTLEVTVDEDRVELSGSGLVVAEGVLRL